MKASAGIMLIWRFAKTEAGRSRHECIEPEHFVEAMTRGESLTDDEMLKLIIPDAELRRGTAAELALVQDVLASLGINTVALRRSLRARLGTGDHPHVEGATVHRSERCRRDFALAERLASDSGASLLAVPYLFLAILNDEGTHLAEAVETVGEAGSKDALRDELNTRLHVAVPAGDEPDPERESSDSDTPWLDKYGRDLTAEASAGRLGPVIGRREEILQVLQTLSRSTKNNPVLVGEAGVGKTAIVEALAIRATEGKDERVLAGRRIVEIQKPKKPKGSEAKRPKGPKGSPNQPWED